MEDSSNLKQNNQYSLSIRFNSDGFSLLIRDELKNILTTKNIPADFYKLNYEEIINLLLEDVETILNIKNVRLIYESNNYTFIPVPIFKEEDAESYLFFHEKINKKDQIAFNKLQNREIISAFSIPKVLYEALIHLFPRLKIEHHLVWFLSEKIEFNDESCVQIWIRPKLMDVIVLKKGDILLINSYSFQSPEDFTYFTLNIFQQLALDKEVFSVKIHNAENCQELKNHLQKYLKTASCEQ